MHLKRDSVLWWVLLTAGVAGGLATHFKLVHAAFPTLTDVAQARLELAAWALGLIAAYLRMSPADLSEAGRQRLLERNGDTRVDVRKLPALLLVALVGASVTGCASLGGRLVTADQVTHDAIGVTKRTADTVCDVAPRELWPRCAHFYEELVKSIDAADAFNRAVASDQIGTALAGAPQLAEALRRLGTAVQALAPTEADLQAVRLRLTGAIARIRALVKGGGR